MSNIVVISGELAVAGSFLKNCKSIGNIVPNNTPTTIEQVNANATTKPNIGKL